MPDEKDGLRKTGKSPFWQYRFTIGGCRFERSTGETARGKACAKRAEIAAQARAELEAELESRKTAADWRAMPFCAAMASYINQNPERDLRFLDRLLDHFADMPLGHITNAKMSAAAASLYPGRAPATVRRQLYVPVNAIINLAKDDRLRAPADTSRRTQWLFPAQVDALVAQLTTQANPWTPALALFLAGQGTRLKETLAIDACHDINLGHAWCTLRDPKNGHERRITLQPRVIAALSRLPTIGQPGPLFRRLDGRPFKARRGRGGEIRNPFNHAAANAGLPPQTSPHVLRHTWATWFYAATKDAVRLKEEGGWRSNEWQRYTRLAPATLPGDLVRHGWDFADVLGENRGNGVSDSMKSTA